MEKSLQTTEYYGARSVTREKIYNVWYLVIFTFYDKAIYKVCFFVPCMKWARAHTHPHTPYFGPRVMYQPFQLQQGAHNDKQALQTYWCHCDGHSVYSEMLGYDAKNSLLYSVTIFKV